MGYNNGDPSSPDIEQDFFISSKDVTKRMKLPNIIIKYFIERHLKIFLKTKSFRAKDMYSCSGNQALYQYALNLPDINLQHLPLIR